MGQWNFFAVVISVGVFLKMVSRYWEQPPVVYWAYNFAEVCFNFERVMLRRCSRVWDTRTENSFCHKDFQVPVVFSLLNLPCRAVVKIQWQKNQGRDETYLVDWLVGLENGVKWLVFTEVEGAVWDFIYATVFFCGKWQWQGSWENMFFFPMVCWK